MVGKNARLNDPALKGLEKVVCVADNPRAAPHPPVNKVSTFSFGSKLQRA